jgi:hypothetical protein
MGDMRLFAKEDKMFKEIACDGGARFAFPYRSIRARVLHQVDFTSRAVAPEIKLRPHPAVTRGFVPLGYDEVLEYRSFERMKIEVLGFPDIEKVA